MDILYKKCWYCLKTDYIRCNILSYLYPLLWTLRYFVGGGSEWYILLLERSLTARRYCIIGALRSLLPTLIYHQWHTRLPVSHLIQVPRDSPDTFTRAEVLTYYRSDCYSECGMWIVMYIYVHLLKYKRTSSRKTFLSYLFEQKWPHHELSHCFCSFEFPFRSDMISACTPFIV